MITTLYPSDQTRRTVIAAYQANNTAIGWTLRLNAGYLFNPNGTPNKTGAVSDVLSVLEAIGGDALLVRGNCGISSLQNIFVSTTQGMESDDYVAGQLIGDVTFVGGCVVFG